MAIFVSFIQYAVKVLMFAAVACAGVFLGKKLYILNISGTDTFLTGSHACLRRNLLPGKIWLQGAG